MRKILNDPKTDSFYIPVNSLKRARTLIKQGIPRQRVAIEIVRQANNAALRDPTVKDRHPFLKEHPKAQFKIINRRLKMADPNCEESETYTPLLNRLRARKHEAKRMKNATEADLEARRKRHRDYQRKRREDPVQRDRNRQLAKEHYHRRKDEDPVEHEYYLALKRVRRQEDKKDPVKLARLQEQARVSQKKRRDRYHSDPEYREQELAKNRERYRKRRARGWRYEKNSEECKSS